MKYIVQGGLSKTGLKGSIRVPGDKSISHRALMLGAIADGVGYDEFGHAPGSVIVLAPPEKGLGDSVSDLQKGKAGISPFCLAAVQHIAVGKRLKR